MKNFFMAILRFFGYGYRKPLSTWKPFDNYLPVSPGIFSHNWSLEQRIIARAEVKRIRRRLRNLHNAAMGGWHYHTA